MTDCHKLCITFNCLSRFSVVTEVILYYLRLLLKLKKITVTDCVFITGWSTAKADKLNSFTTIPFRMN